MKHVNYLIIVGFFVCMHTETMAQMPSILQSLNYYQSGELTRFYGISLRKEGLTTVDNQGKYAWEVDTVQSLRISDIRYPAGSQSYLMTENEHSALLIDCQNALGCGNSRTHAPQFTNAHLNHPNTTRFSLGNEPPIHTSDFASYGGYKNWVVNMLTISDTSKTYFQSAQALTIFNWDSLTPSQQAQQGPVWDTAVAAWASGDFLCRGIATTEKNRNVNAKTIISLRNHLNLYSTDFPGAKIWFTEWNTSVDPLAQAENDYLQLGVAEMLLSCARLYYETNGQLEALHYHQGWNAQNQSNLINLFSGEWVIGKAGEVYRDFAPLFYGRWGNYVSQDQDTLLTIEAFISEDNRFAVAYVNKNNFDVTSSLGFVAPQRSYGVIYYDFTTSVNDDFSSENNSLYLQNYPNPFNSSAVIRWNSSVGRHTTLNVFDMLGRKVKTLVDEFKPQGEYNVHFDSKELPSGTYFYQLSVGNHIKTKKMIIMK